MQPAQGDYQGSGSDRDRMQIDWRAFDARIDEAAAARISVIFSAWLTPGWASRPQDQVSGSNLVPGPWEVAGEPDLRLAEPAPVHRGTQQAAGRRRPVDGGRLAQWRAAERRTCVSRLPAMAALTGLPLFTIFSNGRVTATLADGTVHTW